MAIKCKNDHFCLSGLLHLSGMGCLARGVWIIKGLLYTEFYE